MFFSCDKSAEKVMDKSRLAKLKADRMVLGLFVLVDETCECAESKGVRVGGLLLVRE
jgi:hypothetical protein